jgi:hypothetical protein
MEQVLTKERRESPRVPYARKVLVQYSDMAWVADVLDLSVGGCGIYRPAGCLLNPGNVAQLFFFEGTGPAVRVSACIARPHPDIDRGRSSDLRNDESTDARRPRNPPRRRRPRCCRGR